VCADVLMVLGLAAWSAASVEVAVAGASLVVAAASMRRATAKASVWGPWGDKAKGPV